MLDLQGGKTSARFTEDGTCPTITRGKGSASDVHSVVETTNSNDVDVSPTLLSTDYKGGKAVVEEKAVCFAQNQRDEVRLLGGDGEVAGAVCAMRATKQQNLIAYENHPQDGRVRESGDVSPTLTGQMGTGGNNVPLLRGVGGERQEDENGRE